MALKKTKTLKIEALSLAKQQHLVVQEFLNQEPTRTGLLQDLINKRGEGKELILLTHLLKSENPVSTNDMGKYYNWPKSTTSNAARDVNEYLEGNSSNIIEPLKAKRIKICVWYKKSKGGVSIGYHFICFNAKTKKYLDAPAAKKLFENLWNDFIRSELRKKLEQKATGELSKKLQGRDDYQVLDMEIGVVPQKTKENEISKVMDFTKSKTYGHNRIWESFNIDSLLKPSNTSPYIISVDAGGGKTTFLRYLQLELLRKSDITPIFLDASKIEEWKLENSSQLAEKMASYFNLNICKNRVVDFLKRNLEEDIILLVDGLDQIKAGGSGYEYLANHVLDLMGKNVIIASRPSAAINQEDENQFTFLRLKPFDTNAQENYFGENFERSKQLSMNASYLIAIPMLANMVRMLIEEKQDGNINNRAELYEKFIGYILTKYKHGKAKLSPGLRTQIRISLGKIAYDALAEKEPHIQKIPLDFCYDEGRLPDDPTERKDELLTKSGLVNLIIDRSGWGDKDFLFFTHQSYQEYFAADYAAKDNNNVQKILSEKWNPKWNETIKFLAGMLGENFIKKIADRGTVVTMDMKKRIRSLRHLAGFNIESLADKAAVSEKTLKKIENPKSRQKRFDDDTLIKIAKAFDISFDELLGKKGQYKHENWPINFEFLVEQFREIDRMLLPLIRDHRHASRSLIENAYHSLLSQCLQERDICLQHVDRKLRDPIKRESFIKGLPNPTLVVDVSENFAEISYNCHPTGMLTIKSPQLFWDCHCDTPSMKQNDFECPIHSQSLGEEVDRCFSTGYVLIRYRDIEFYWRRGQELWPPSIDSFYMMDAMEADGLFTKKYNSVLDIGSGTGFLGIMAVCCNPYITEITLSDWLLTPYLYGTTNWFLNRKKREHISFKANTALFTGGLDSLAKPYDIAICNPPYLPLLEGFDEIGLESTVAGTDLLVDVILRNKALANRIYLQFSNIARPEAQSAQEKTGLKLRPIGKERLVPFRMSILWERSDYLNVLVKERGLIEKKNSRHRFWHLLQSYVIE